MHYNFKYQGDFKEDLPHGFGRKQLSDGSWYVGQFSSGMFNGNGKFRWPDGSEFEGQWKNNEMKGLGTKRLRNGMVEIYGNFDGNSVNGKGYKKWKRVVVHNTSMNNNPNTSMNGAQTNKNLSTSVHRVTELYVYRGMMKDSKIEGQGEFKWPDGRHYIGEFVNSCMQGYGKLIWHDAKNAQGAASKSVYKGEFVANIFHGQGKINWGNGDIYEGAFENGQYHGEGDFRWGSNQKLFYKGEFKRGKMHGFGVFNNPYGVFEGEFKFGFLEGKAVATFYNGDKYSGEFHHSQMTGYGCYYNITDGTQIIGVFENGVCNKHGKKIYPDGRIYIGEFINDIENGKGVMINGDLRIRGIWRNAQLVEELVQQPLMYETSNAVAVATAALDSQSAQKSNHGASTQGKRGHSTTAGRKAHNSSKKVQDTGSIQREDSSSPQKTAEQEDEAIQE